MEFEKVVRARHSVRDFTSQEIPDETLRKIVEIAQRTPSWTNSQPWKVYIAKGQHLKQIKKDHLQKAQAGAPSNVDMKQTSRSTWGQLPVENSVDWSNKLGRFLQPNTSKMGQSQIELFNASALVYLVAEKEVSPWMVYDIGAFSQTLMLAAKDNGVDSIPAYEIVRFADNIHQVMNIPDNEEIIAGIALGYPSEEHINDFYTDRDSTDDILKIED